MKRTFFLLLALCLVSLSFGRVGPVSQYGQLMAGKAGSKGQIYGSCEGIKSGKEVAVQGMSLFWAISSDVGSPFWTSSIVSGLVEKQNIQIIRAPMGVDENWGSGNYFSDMNKYQSLMNAVVQAAIDNDIYVIIDYHSHKASDNVNNAKTFFSYMAQKWGGYDNVIFEVFNEPTSQSWGTIKTYAESVIETIRQYSDNLVLVGNPDWDQHPDYAIGNTVRDSKNNVAYTFHFYAGSHSVGGEGANADRAMNAGLSVFVSEWGTVNADGGGGVSGNSSSWLNWMNSNKLSGANWSVSNKNEGASYFSGSAWNYSNSGQWVNTNIFSKLPKSYTKCGNAPSSSNSNPTSSASNPNSSASQGGGTNKTLVVDNFEDGNYTSLWNSPWGIYNDNDKQANSTIDTAMVSGNGSSKAVQITYRLDKGTYEYSPFVGLVVSANADETTTEDLSACTAIQYDYEGGAHDFRVESSVDVEYNYHKSAAQSSNGWKTRTVYWTDLAQETGWGRVASIDDVQKAVRAFSWQIQGTSGTTGTLQIDNVKCLGLKETSSSSVAQSSSSVKPSSSSVQSSSSVKPSSSSVASSSSAKLVITGNLTQTVLRGGSISPVIFTNVNSFQRNSQNVYYLNMTRSGNVLTLDAVVPTSANLGTFRENFTVNGTAYTMVLTVNDISSSSVQSSSSVSSSSQTPASSAAASSASVSNDWQSNTQLTVNTNGDVVIGQSNGWTPDRVVTKGLGEVEANKSYTLSFDASIQQNTMDMAVSLSSYCSGTVELDASEGVQAYTCTFKATKTESVVLTLTMPGSRWESVTISNLSLKLADGHEVLSSSSVAPSSSSVAIVKHDVKFVVNGKVIQTIKVAEGEIPEAPASVELPKNDAQYSYSFGGWTPEIVAVTGPATYTANIVQTINAYKITFLNYDNSELWWAEVNYGKVPVYGGPEPTREPSKSYRYEFKGWNPELKKVVGKASYAATYNEIPLSESSSSAQVSSSSTETSSSSVASSASTGVVVTGDLTQNVVKGAEFETVTFTNVTSFTKETYYIWWLSYDYVGNTLTISNSQSTQWLQAGDWNEKINVNGTTYEIQVTVVEPESSAASSSSSNETPNSSESRPSSSSSAVTPASSGSSTMALRGAMKFPVSVVVNGRTLLIEGGQATVEVFDLQGRPLARFIQVSGAVELTKFNAGSYILRVKSGTQVQNRKITLK
ncbi:cellulase family glycosylhydrolase [Fibrobacter sp.]|uniref:cellulase family glycosylhydrolase n=1 Tax=Fibrobacter sp. TaxID=35828 RepID=UPI00388E6071